MRNVFRFAFVAALSMGLSACGSGQGPSQSASVSPRVVKVPVSSEMLLAADGFIGFSGLKTAAIMPESRHLAARDRVRPWQTKGHLPYTDYLRRADMMAASHYREVSFEKESDFGLGALKVAALNMISGVAGIPSPVEKPSLLPEATLFQVAEAGRVVEGLPHVDDGLAPVMAAKPVFATTRMAAFLDKAFAHYKKVQEVLPEDKQPEVASVEADVAADETPVNNSAFDLASLDSENLSVVNMRMGDYEDKTRLVLDLSAAAKFDYDLDNTDSVLTVHIDGAEWDLDTKKYFDDHPLIKSYEVSTADGHDVTLEISLKHPSKMVMSGFVRPDKQRGHRIFFDVAAL